MPAPPPGPGVSNAPSSDGVRRSSLSLSHCQQIKVGFGRMSASAVADYFACYPEIMPEIPYEIAKVQAENAALIAEQNPFAMTTPYVQKHLADEPWTRDAFHAEGLKYFDEVGVMVP